MRKFRQIDTPEACYVPETAERFGIPRSRAGFSFYQEQSGAYLATRVNLTAEFAVRGNQFNEIASFPDTKPIFAANFAFRGKQTDYV